LDTPYWLRSLPGTPTYCNRFGEQRPTTKPARDLRQSDPPPSSTSCREARTQRTPWINAWAAGPGLRWIRRFAG